MKQKPPEKSVTIRRCGFSPVYWEIEITGRRKFATKMIRKWVPELQRLSAELGKLGCK